MRADRLIALLMLLQTRGSMTAQELAAQLEVTERTIYRDINALSSAGVPVYSERGPGGGIRLVESYRSDLTGLTRDEVQALFMLTIPPALQELGLGRELQAAMLKLAAGLPTALRADERRVRQRVYIDPLPWRPEIDPEDQGLLPVLQRAVWEGRRLQVRYNLVARPDMPPLDSSLDPFGIAHKANHWYLVARRRDHLTVLRLDRFQQVQLTDEFFELPPDFNLAQFWEQWCRHQAMARPLYCVDLRIKAAVLDQFHSFKSEVLADQDGWLRLSVSYEYLEQARQHLLPLGGAVQVLQPPALRAALEDYARQILAVYSQELCS
ncbi:MAG: YafY family transcriptional regulator [Anaerolineales bacterium]|nr:YafY family transcriptional regulator [Anaerolineales bacterium]